MVKRSSTKSLQFYSILAFALILLVMSWESNRSNAAVIVSEIPQESIRLRILANSDSPQDQALKRDIRDAIVAQMEQWVTGPQTIEEARAFVTDHLSELDQLVGAMIQQRGYKYEHTVELGIVPFPTKMYGNQVYPAGDYEALRVTIGEAKGQNWWCVLFPPLCFVDSVSGEAVAAAAVVADDVKAKDSSNEEDQGSDSEEQTIKSEKPEVRFFLWDLIKKIAAWFV
jgi:stage II sporulation protein R